MIEVSKLKQILELHNSGFSCRQIAAIVGLGKSTVNKYINLFSGEEIPELESVKTQGPRILFFDLESSPSIVATFGRWKVNIGTESVVREGGILLSACWKFAGDKEVTKIVLTPEEAKNDCDLRIVANLLEAFDNADIVIGHNAVKFDYPLFKTRLIAHGFHPPKSVKIIDTLQIAKTLRFNSNKLDSLGNYLQVGRKIQTTGMGLWLRCIEGDKEALAEMLRYNEQDVILLEQVYNKLRAFDTKPVNAGHYYDDNSVRCPVCGSDHVYETGNSAFTAVSEYKEYACHDCGHRSRSRSAINSKEKRQNLLVSAR